MEKKVLHVQMFGGFSMRYGQEAISFRRTRNSKSVLLLQMLLLSMPGGISKSGLIDHLYKWNGGAEPADYNNSLNVLIHRLKKQLISGGLPEDDYIEIRNGICSFRCKIPLEIDTWRFEKILAKAGSFPGGWSALSCFSRRINYIAANCFR